MPTKIVLLIIIKGIAGANGSGNRPEDRAITLGINPKNTASRGPIRKVTKISDIFTKEPVIS